MAAAGVLPENFVPYLDYKEKQQQWQWIGAGRDSDMQSLALCQHWLQGQVAPDALDASQGSPPPPKCTTDWTVRPTTDEERGHYRGQECVRYQNPHRAFTFRVHGYEAVVGPVKGVYGKESGVNKAREHSLLVSDRPPFVTILSLVRDAAARLPNGEGTRADICELLKDSQYLAPASDQQIHTVVSGALDRLHYEKDPCVKYDVNRKLWIYLHRSRTEEEFGEFPGRGCRLLGSPVGALQRRSTKRRRRLPGPRRPFRRARLHAWWVTSPGHPSPGPKRGPLAARPSAAGTRNRSRPRPRASRPSSSSRSPRPNPLWHALCRAPR